MNGLHEWAAWISLRSLARVFLMFMRNLHTNIWNVKEIFLHSLKNLWDKKNVGIRDICIAVLVEVHTNR